MTETIHYLTLAPGVRLCLGCGERFRADAEHDFAVCYEAFVKEQESRWPPLRTIPPAS